MISIQEVKRFCKNYTEIENYDKAIADTTQTWHCHHRLELIETGAVVNSSRQDLIDWGIYYDRPADELIFLTAKDHNSLHHKGNTNNKGKKRRSMSEETKLKISETISKMGWRIDPSTGKRVWYRKEI